MVGEKERKVHYLTEEGRALYNKLFQRFAHLVSVAIESTDVVLIKSDPADVS